MVESLEDRVVMASPLSITGVSLQGLSLADGVLTAASGTVTGTLAGLPFTTQITNFSLQLLQNQGTGPCSVLSLHLAPIHLQLLGLHVDTSAICLDVTATPGGGVLGDLLCGLADGLPLGTLPGLDTLNSTVQNILGSALGGALANAKPTHGNDSVCTGQCDILDLSLGPVDLSLLGLNVSLDNCANGPVQVCVSASRGEGLLGDLLCGLSGRPHSNFSLQDITRLLDTATTLLDAAGNLLQGSTGKLTSLVNHLKK